MSEKLVYLPFTYELDGVPLGKRASVSVEFMDEQPLALPIVDSQAAPIGVVERRDTGEVKSEYRAFNGRLYKRSDGLNPNLPMPTVDEFEALLARLKDPEANVNWRDYPVDFAKDYTGVGIRFKTWLPMGHDGQMKRIDRSRWQEARDRAEAAAQGYLAVDGAIWRSAPELVWCVGRSLMNGAVGVVNGLIPEYNSSEFLMFRGDRRDDAIAFAEDLARRANCAVNVATTHEDRGLVEWRFDDVGNELKTVSKRIMTLAKGDHFWAMPVAFYEPFTRMRDAYRDGVDPSIQDRSVLRAAILEMADALKGKPASCSLMKGIAETLAPVALRLRTVDREPELAAALDADEAALAMPGL